MYLQKVYVSFAETIVYYIIITFLDEEGVDSKQKTAILNFLSNKIKKKLVATAEFFLELFCSVT